MERQPGACPLTRRRITDEYFLENRNRLLEIAAFLDRLERSQDGSREGDYRMQAFEAALRVLCDGEDGESTPRELASRVRRIQMIFSDPTTEPKANLDRKNAAGAYNPNSQEES